ncbi:MAG: methyltransferase domain-containing protein [Anaerolineales bacterium]|nr:methyltransferase domain-containing protein [Anaerolineales bacterium]
MRIIQFILHPIFFLLYHQFAWMYDLVAAVVSLGHWNEWVRSILPYIENQRVLELGHGTGHLQLALHEAGFQVFGLDESRQMSRQAARRLRKKGIKTNLSRGLAQSLPFRRNAFQNVALTFPSEYIFDPPTLTEIQRVLMPGGRLVILPIAWITGKRPLERLAAWLFRFTGEAPGKPGELNPELKNLFARAGFEVRKETVQQESSLLLFLLARKLGRGKNA